MSDLVQILDGNTFVVSDSSGDIEASLTDPTGLFSFDTRFLSRWVLTVNGERPLFLSTVQGEPFNATFFVRNPIAGGLGRDEMTIARARNVSDGMEDSMVVRSHAARPLAFSLEVELATDFADIFAVKQYDFSLGDPLHARPLPPPADSELTGDDGLVFASSDGYPGRTQIFFSSQPVAFRLSNKLSQYLRAMLVPSLKNTFTPILNSPHDVDESANAHLPPRTRTV